MFSGVQNINNVCPKLPYIKLHSGNLNKWVYGNDLFCHAKEAKSFEDKELERLFPNGEIDKIYNNLINEYGLETPPALNILKSDDTGDRGNHIPTSNKINITLDFLNPDAKKFLVNINGKQLYSIGDSGSLLFRVKDKDINEELTNINNAGFKGKAVPLSDDDKRKILIFTLAHEMYHAYQNQCVRHTEGLDEWEMIQTRFNKFRPQNINLIKEKLILIETKKKYDKLYTAKDFEKKYSQNSPEGKQAKIWFDANVNYSKWEENYEDYINNPVEKDANIRAKQYLIKNYGDFIKE